MNNYMNPMGGMPYSNTYQTSNYSYRLPTYEIVRVNGRGGANAFQMGANSSILLLDETDNVVWLAQTDGAGYKTVTPFKISPYDEQPVVDVSAITARIEALENSVRELKEMRNVKSDFRGNAKPNQQNPNKPTNQ
jgi:hypothetical protein